jgi:formate dehydrogenase iron-sulfur subunit
MTTRILVPDETSACSLGADAVADAIARQIESTGLDARVVRNGSRGMYWLEPLIELDLPGGRIGFGPVTAADVPSLFDGKRLPDAAHRLSVGRVDETPYLRAQQRLTFVRAGIIEPLSVEQYRSSGGLVALERALTLSAQQIVDEVKQSGLRGRGGAAFPAGIKWQTTLDAPGPQKYIVCNADEGDSGTFADRLLMEADPFQLIEGMAIASLGAGADRGFIYLRSEYPKAFTVLTRALDAARTAGFLGPSLLGSTRSFDIDLRLGAGAYVCGEETSMLDSIEGKRGLVRAKPPLPAIAGLFGKPTLIHNVLTLAAATTILARGGDYYASHGVGRSRGTMPFQLCGNIARGGLVEVDFGMTLQSLLDRFGHGSRSGRALKAVQAGGPLGAYLPPALWSTPLDYEAFAAVGAMLGHGGIVAFDDTVDLGEQAEFAMQFCADESCGKCTPCRIGSVRGVEVIKRIRRGENAQANIDLLTDLCETMELGSLCALGGLTPMPVRSVLKHFAQELIPTERVES